MSYSYNYQQDALDEYKEATVWYLERSEMAAYNFIKEVKQSIELICSDPTRYRNTYKEFRETSLKKYPYAIVYLIDNEKEQILSPRYIIIKETHE